MNPQPTLPASREAVRAADYRKPVPDISGSSAATSAAPSALSTIFEPEPKDDKSSTHSSSNNGQPPSYPTAASSETNLGSDTNSIVKKKQELPWEGYLEDPLPEKVQNHYMRNLRHQIFFLYRRIFGVVFLANFGILVYTAVRGADAAYLGMVTVANIFVAIVMRQDYVINIFFNVACMIPQSWPLAIRRVAARVFHIGGIHSGAGTAGTMWLIFFTVQATKEMINGRKVSIPTVVVTYVILLELVTILALAYPTFRQKHHDTFEMVHRFLGWSALALVWAQVVLLSNDYKPSIQPLGKALLHSVPFWLTVVMTISIILPWLRLRKVDVRGERLSNHAVRLHFDYVTPKAGSFTRVSHNPLTEWHSFAAIPVPGKKGYSVIVSRAGDWTSEQIANPPSKIWVRNAPTFGVMRIVPLFRRVLIVATGSGIAPCAPHVLEGRTPIKLLWTSPDVRQTFGDEFVDLLMAKAPDSVIYDTRKYGKPDMVKLTYRLYKEFNAEAICIISNEKLTEKVVYGMTSRGIPCFGAIWDS